MDVRQYRQLESEGYGIITRQNFPASQTHCNRVEFTDKDLEHVFDLLSAKGSRLFIAFANNKEILTLFKAKHLYENNYAKIGIRKILYDLANERKLGKGLKGLSKIVLSEIEAKIWEILELEIKLFRKDEQIRKYSEGFHKCSAQVFKLEI